MLPDDFFFQPVRRIQCCVVVVLLLMTILLVWIGVYPSMQAGNLQQQAMTHGAYNPESPLWHAPDSAGIPHTEEGDRIRYGRLLVARTSEYLGPTGSVRHITNGMNCQNCHLDAGRKPYGNNFSAVASTYPKFRARSGTVETVSKRINDCLERSLNGVRLDTQSLEMKSIVAYILWVGHQVPKDSIPAGAGLTELKMMERPADPTQGRRVFQQYCTSCHGTQGKGIRNSDGSWKYPPLHGDSSYTTAAGLFRLSRFAGYVKTNMPYGIRTEDPVLTDEEAWDVAAFINSLPRPVKIFRWDWPDISKKPFDHPFGPYSDRFTEKQHKYGPFGEIRRRPR